MGDCGASAPTTSTPRVTITDRSGATQRINLDEITEQS
jgi:hypothetical protein